MESKILSSLGKASGLAGIALGVVLLLFQGVLQKQFLPQAGLGSAQAFAVILALMILTFGIAGIGVIAWLLGRAVGPKAPVTPTVLGVLAALIAGVVGAAVYVGAQAQPDPSPHSESDPLPSSRVEAGPGGVAIGGSVSGSTISVGRTSGGETRPK